MNPLFQATDDDRGVRNLHNVIFLCYFVKKGQIRFRDFKELITDIYLDGVDHLM